MQVHFWERLRDERKFPSPDALRSQISRDLSRARRFFSRLSRASVSTS
jgi:FAD synthase